MPHDTLLFFERLIEKNGLTYTTVFWIILAMSTPAWIDLEGFPPAIYAQTSLELYLIARDECLKIQSDGPYERGAITVVLLGTMSLEAFIGEMTTVDKSVGRMGVIKTLLDQIERSSLAAKFNVAYSFLSGHVYDEGALPYQDFDLLIDVRNFIVHPKPENLMNKEPPKTVRKLLCKKLCMNRPSAELVSWRQQMATKALARWACNSVVNMVLSFQEYLNKEALEEAQFVAICDAFKHFRIR